MNRTKKEIKNYFKKYIFGYIFNDIENCIKAKANYTVALALLSYTEFLGALINGNLGEPGNSHKNFNKALEYFEWNENTDYYKDFKITFKDINGKEKDGDIYTLFRCGLAHEYFIKGDSFVHNNPNGFRDAAGIFYGEGCIDSDAGVQVIEEKGKKKLRFHNNAYFRDFKKAWQKYYRNIIRS